VYATPAFQPFLFAYDVNSGAMLGNSTWARRPPVYGFHDSPDQRLYLSSFSEYPVLGLILEYEVEEDDADLTGLRARNTAPGFFVDTRTMTSSSTKLYLPYPSGDERQQITTLSIPFDMD
jgi:hypothetical protein